MVCVTCSRGEARDAMEHFIRCHHSVELSQTVVQDLTKQIRDHYHNQRLTLAQDRRIFDIPLAARLLQPTTALHDFIQAATPLITHSMQQALQVETTGVRQIVEYFQIH